MRSEKRWGSIDILLTAFLFLVVALFAYLFQIEKGIKHYNTNHNLILSLELMDREFNEFATSINTFSNYDTINRTLARFQTNLTHLSTNLATQYARNARLREQAGAVRSMFTSNAAAIEHFKSLNAALIGGAHYLFDLQRTISETDTIAPHTKNTINEALFFLLRYIGSNYIDKHYIRTQLAKLHSLTQKTRQPHIRNFHTQTLILLDIAERLKRTASAIRTSQLPGAIHRLSATLDALYQNDIAIQKNITLLFFLSVLAMLIALIIGHRRASKNAQELSAFRYAVEHSDNAIIITDPQRRITFVNEGFERTTGYTRTEALGQTPNILKSGKHDDRFYQAINAQLNQGRKWEGEFINKRKDGSLYYEKVSIVPVFSDKELTGYLAIKLDITKYIEQNLQLAQAASVFEHTEEAIIITDTEGKIASVNRAFSDIYGYTLVEVRGKNPNLLHSGRHDQDFYTHMWEQIHAEGVWRGKLINTTRSGEEIPVWTTIKKITDHHGNVTNYIATQNDLHEVERSRARADYLAYHDQLTGLYNRVNFEEYLSRALSLARRSGQMLAVVFIDLDRFKIINDTLGHDVGDQVLITVASRLKATLRESDFISRWGGDEFVVILENMMSVNATTHVATKLIDIFKEPIVSHGHTLVTTASIGIALFPRDGTDAGTLIKHADSAMYQAKEDGKNTYCYYTSELSRQIQYKLEIDLALRSALSQHEISMVFQPQYDLQTRTIAAVEALTRWEHPKLGVIPPDCFVPIAEESGVIVPLGYFIFEEACKGYSAMKRHAVSVRYVAVNVSIIQFKEPDLLERFLAIASHHAVDPSEIEIEITERFLMENTLENIAMLQRFRDHGFKISIDDFGTGYSSMSYLKNLPVDTIKIDKSFVHNIQPDSNDTIIIEAIIALSKTLGYSVIAEGIETPEQEQFLSRTQCDLGQGYLFASPARKEAIIERFGS